MSSDPQSDHAFRAGTPFGTHEENWFAGATSLFRRAYAQTAEGADVAVLGVPFDGAVTNRPGTRFGPRAIRAASAALSWSGAPWRQQRNPFDALSVVDTGDLAYDVHDRESFPARLEARTAELVEGHAKLLSLGGDHFITYPILKALAARHGPLALVQFDSHSDTWREDSQHIDHGTMFFHAIREGLVDPARSTQLGIRSGNPETHGLEIVDADAFIDTPPADLATIVRQRAGEGPAYLTFDIDCLDPAYAPGTGTPVCGGPSTNKAERVLTALGGIDFVGFDVVEVSPPYDHADITALAAATMALGMLGLAASAR